MKRFDLKDIEFMGPSEMVPDEHGEYVLYGDVAELGRERDEYRSLRNEARDEVYRLRARVAELEADPRMALDHVDLQLASEACDELAEGKWIWRSPAAEAAFGVIAARLRFCVQYHHPPVALAAMKGDET